MRNPISRTLQTCIAATIVAAASANAATISKCTVDGPGGSNTKSMVPSTGQVSLDDLAVTLNNTSAKSRRATIHFAADAGVAANAEMRLVFSVDGAAGQYMGPQNLANTTQYWQTRSTLASVLIEPGVHTLTPRVFVQGVDGSHGFVDDRCIFVTF